MDLKVTGKKLNTAKIKNLLTQDEKGIDTINIVLPKMYNDIDLSAFTFKMRGASEKSTLTEQLLMKSIVGENLNLLWTVTSDFTAVSGVLALEVVGVDTNYTEIIKITADDIFVKSGVLGTYNPPTDILENALAQMQTAVATCQALADGLVIQYDIKPDRVGLKHANETTFTYNGSLVGPTTVIENVLTSTSTVNGLSAYQGKVLNDKVMNIGGANLNTNTAWLTDTAGYAFTASGWARDPSIKMGNCISAKVGRTGLVTTSTVYVTGALPTNLIPCKVGDAFTVSVYLMTTDYTAIDDVLRLGIDQLDAANAYIRSTDVKPYLTENNVWRKYTHTITITDAAVKSIRSFVGIYKNGMVWMAGIKVERGYIATDWSPNPQDLRDASCQLLLGTFATRPTTVAQKSMYLATDKAVGDVNRLTLSTDGVTWYQI